MPGAQGHLEYRPGQEQPFRGDAARVALPGVEQASLCAVVIPRAGGCNKNIMSRAEEPIFFSLK